MGDGKWTPGPRRVLLWTNDDGRDQYDVMAGPHIVATTREESDAILDAAAPRLYEAAEFALPFLSLLAQTEKSPELREAANKIRAALAKARGES